MTEKAEETGGKGPASLDLQMDRAHPARVYDYFLGGKDNFPADRELGDLIAAVTPEMRDTAHINRSFMVRAVKYVAECGVDQFLDLGTGIPTSPNTHEVAQSVIPGAHVVYVDNDPIVSVHGRALLATDSTTALVQADIRDIDRLLEEPKLRQLIDFSRPVAIMLVAVLHYVTDEDDPGREVLRKIANELTQAIRRNMTIDWHVRKSARAGMRRIIKRLLKKYDYPPEQAKKALDTVMRQAELMAENTEVRDWNTLQAAESKSEYEV